MKHQHHVRLLVAGAAACSSLALSACGGGADSPAAGGDVTVTVTPTVTASGSAPATTSAAPAPPKSDVVGRAYDFGQVVKASTVGGVAVIELDRWTWKGLADTKLAKQGVPLDPFKGKVPYENQNAKLTYTIPVADGAAILYHHCLAADQPLQTKSVSAADLKGLGDRENGVLVKLDDQGRVVAADNVPGCPG